MNATNLKSAEKDTLVLDSKVRRVLVEKRLGFEGICYRIFTRSI